MAGNRHNPQAVFVLPPGRHGRIVKPSQRRWLSRGRLSLVEAPEETLSRILRAIGHEPPSQGLAALRFWGQTGERSGAWMAAADPVHLEARLNHLCLFAFELDAIPRSDLRELYEHLQQVVGDEDRFAFARLGPLIYLRCKEGIASAAVSPAVVDGLDPSEFLPAGEAAQVHDRLVSEMQMALHDHAVNLARESSGKRSVNSIWIWGGGIAPEAAMRAIPPVFSEDALVRGYWLSCHGVGHAWMEDFDAALERAPGGFVAVAPERKDRLPPDAMSDRLDRLRRLLQRGHLASLLLLFGDGLTIRISRHDAYRFWKSVSPMLKEAFDD